MQGMLEEQEILVRGTAEHKSYLWYKLGWIKAIVNYVEESISITGRLMLLSYIAYIAVQAGMQSILHTSTPPVLDIIMLALQVIGLEGSIPGLIHTSETLAEHGKTASARMVRQAADTAQWLAIATIGDLFLLAVNQAVSDHAATLDTRLVGTAWGITFCYSWVLLGLRVYVIGKYLISMALVNRRDVRIISRSEEQLAQQKVLAGVPDYSQLLDDLRTQIQAELVSSLSSLRTELSAQIDAKRPSVNYPETVSHLQSTLDDWRPDIVAQGSAKMDSIEPLDYDAILEHSMPAVETTVNARVPELMSMDEIASQLAPLLSYKSASMSAEDEIENAHPDELIDLESRRITRVLDDQPNEQESDHRHEQPNTDKLSSTISAKMRTSGSNETLKKVRKLIKRNEQITPTEIAQKVSISTSHARKLKARILAEQSA